jgi:hypothetical protein
MGIDETSEGGLPSVPERPSQRLTANEVVAATRLVQEVMEAVMKPDVHYGTVRGCGPKPMLFKAGAEKIASAFRLAIEPLVEDLSTADAIRYRVTTRVTHITTGFYMGSGVGECSSDETKYKWRAAISDMEFAATPEDRKRHKFYKDGSAQQVRTEPSDIANTVLKMAKKRSAVDAVLSCTAASDCFGQDLEDLPEEVRAEIADGNGGDDRPAVKPPKRKKKPAKDAKPAKPAKPPMRGESVAVGVIENVTTKTGENKNGPWTNYQVQMGGETFSTFVDDFGQRAESAWEMGRAVTIAWEKDGRYKNITDLTENEAPADDPIPL